MLLDVGVEGKLRINAPRPKGYNARPGPRPALPLTRADSTREAEWVDQAVEALFTLEDTCALDVADRGPQGLMGTSRKIGVNHSWTHRIIAQVRERKRHDDKP